MPGPNWWEYMTPEQRAEEFRRRWAAPAPVSPPPQPAAPMPIEGGIPSLPVPLLAGALDIMQRPNYAIAGMAQSALGQRPEGMLQAGWQGLMGQTRPTFGTVLEQAGVSELGRLGPITGRGVLGLGLDIITDPTTYLGIGAAGKLTKAGRLVSQVATKTAQAALPAETALGAVMATGRRAGQAGVREATALGAKGLVGEGGLTFAGKTVVPASTLEGVFKPLQQVFRRIPGEATIEESLGTLFVPGYKLKKAGAGEVYERMQDIRRLPKAVQAETARELAPLFEPLTEVQRRRFFELANTSTNIDDYVKEGLDDLGNYYLGTWRPKYDAIAQDLGIPLWESAFIHHMKADPTTQSIFDTFRKRAGEGKGVTGKTVEELEQAGMNVDALRAMSVEAASKQTILEMQTLLTDAINKYGAVVKRKGGVIPEGLVEFTPSGKWGEALRRTLKAPQGSTYYLPEPLANAFGVLGRPQETIGFLKYFDVVQGIWKGSVTSIFPEFHARNALGNVFNAWLGGNYNPMTYARGARLQFDEQYFDAAIKAEGTCKSREQFFDALRRKGGTGFGFFGGEYAATVPSAMRAGVPEVPPAAARAAAPEAALRPDEWLHGSRTGELTALAEPYEVSRVSNLFGEGLYLTKSSRVATGYAGKTGAVTTIRVKPNLKLIDLEKPLSQDVVDEIVRFAEQESEFTDTVATITRMVQEGQPGEKIYAKLADDIASGGGLGVLETEASEIFNILVDGLKGKGYRGFTYTGGKRLQRGQGLHEVTILWNPKEDATILGRIPEAVTPPITPAPAPRGVSYGARVAEFAGLPFRAGKHIGEGIENNAKIAFILDKLDKNFSLDDAIMESKKYLFDYTELTDFEKSTLRRLVPFYTWTRKNLPLQIEAMITQPGKAVSVGKVRTAANQDAGLKKEEEALFPYWLQEQLNIVIGRDAEGDPKVMQGIGIPIEDINKLWRGKSLRTMERFLAEGSPLLRVPYEILTNRSLFTSKAITDPSVNNYYRRAYPLLADVPVLRDWLGLKKEEVVINGEKRNVYNADPQRMYLLNSIIGRMYTTVGKLSRENMDMVEKVMDFLMPGKQVNLDLDRAVVDFTLDMDKAMKDSNAKVETAARAFQAGKITGRQYRGVRTEAAQVRSINMDKLAEIAAEQQGIFPAEREANLQAIRTSDAAALHKYQTIEPDDPKYLDAETGLVDWDAYFGAKRSFLAGLSPNDRLYIEQHTKDYVKRLSPQAQKVELQYLKAKEAMDEYAQIPRFVGLTKEDEQAKERAEQIYNGVMSQLRARYPTATGQLLDKLRVMAWSEAGKSEPRGVALRKAKENPARVKFRNTHPEIALFYRDVLIPQQEG